MTNIQEEIWKDIIGFEGEYQISNLSNIRSLDRPIITNNQWGEYTQIYEGRKLKGIVNTNGYVRVDLKKGKLYLVHRLVAIHFIPNPDNKPEINHIDGNPQNNKISNLEWCTHSENIRHADRTGLRVMAKGGDHSHALKVIDSKTGIVYGCIREAYSVTGYSYPYVIKMLSGIFHNKTTLRYAE